MTDVKQLVREALSDPQFVEHLARVVRRVEVEHRSFRRRAKRPLLAPVDMMPLEIASSPMLARAWQVARLKRVIDDERRESFRPHP